MESNLRECPLCKKLRHQEMMRLKPYVAEIVLICAQCVSEIENRMQDKRIREKYSS